jgi:glycosyltransferase involved in cell wall biosynthesis
LPRIYQDHDIFVLPSLNEAMGNVTQEAIASGLALLTTDTGAAELLDNNGFIIKKNDFHDMSERLSLLIMNPGLLHRFRQRSAEIGRTMSWKSCADSYIRVYESCRNRNPVVSSKR